MEDPNTNINYVNDEYIIIYKIKNLGSTVELKRKMARIELQAYKDYIMRKNRSDQLVSIFSRKIQEMIMFLMDGAEPETQSRLFLSYVEV